eukprot:5035264-Pyramimonas_sp.AAC.1
MGVFSSMTIESCGPPGPWGPLRPPPPSEGSDPPGLPGGDLRGPPPRSSSREDMISVMGTSLLSSSSPPGPALPDDLVAAVPLGPSP